MALIDDLLFETERRVILFKSNTKMPDGSQLGYNGDPNNAVESNSDGEFLIYNCPNGSRYQEDDGTQWYKKSQPNLWETFGGRGGVDWESTPNEGEVVYASAGENLSTSSNFTYNNGKLNVGQNAGANIGTIGPGDDGGMRSGHYDITLVDNPYYSSELLSGTSLEIGEYAYRVAYVTDQGETRATRELIDTSSGNQKVKLTGLAADDVRVIETKIWRTEVDMASWGLEYYHLATIPPDQDEYIDDLSDADLTTGTPTSDPEFQSNNSSNFITVDNTPAMQLGNATIVGRGAYNGASIPLGNPTIIGNYAGSYGTETDASVCIGGSAAARSNLYKNVAIGSGSLIDNTGEQNTAIGHNSGSQNTGNYITFVGFESGENNSGDRCVSIGYSSGYANTERSCTFVGFESGKNNRAGFGTFLGQNSGESNSGIRCTAIGMESGQDNDGNNTTFLGHRSGQNNVSDYVVGIGSYAARYNSAFYCTMVGNYAGAFNEGRDCSLFGYEAGNGNTGHWLSAFGNYAGKDNTGRSVIAIGYRAGEGNSDWYQFILHDKYANADYPMIQGNLQTLKVGFGGITDPSETIDAKGSVKADQFKLSDLNSPPASATDTGTKGEVRITEDYIYVCVDTDTWKRTQLGSW